MKPELARQIAEAMETTPELLPFLPELLADLEELGASRRVILDLVRPLNLPAGSRVLDLGCGKGAVLLALAEECGFHGTGIDAFPPFIEAAQRTALARGLAAKCKFRRADMLQVASEYRDFDVAMMLAVGAAVGDPARIVGLLRRCVHRGGYMVIDDAFLASSTQAPIPEYAGYSDHETALRKLTSWGDQLVKEYVPSPEEVLKEIPAQTKLIRRRAEELWRKHPQAKEFLQAYVRRQGREAELVQESVRWVVWLLQRRD